MTTAASSMTPGEFELLRDIIYKRSGIHFPDNKKYVLESRLSRRLEELELDNYKQYCDFLTIGPYREDEFQEMFNRITINETSFFRNEPQHDVFEQQILPALIRARADSKKLRIWSCACSTGEEPYTLAIQVHRTLGVRVCDWHVDILGTDISEKVLVAAQAGRYTNYSIRTMDPHVTKRYFTQDNGIYQISETIQSMVVFERLNLKDAFAAKRFGVWDVIFCRNVMIYFDDEMKAACARLFYEQLADDGTVFIGHSESLRNTQVPFESLTDSKAFAYTKAPKDKGATSAA